MSTKTETGAIETDAQDAVATRTADHKKSKDLLGELDKLEDGVTVVLKIYIELEESPSHELGDGLDATTLN
jgi:hypothetical protein